MEIIEKTLTLGDLKPGEHWAFPDSSAGLYFTRKHDWAEKEAAPLTTPVVRVEVKVIPVPPAKDDGLDDARPGDVLGNPDGAIGVVGRDYSVMQSGLGLIIPAKEGQLNLRSLRATGFVRGTCTRFEAAK